MLFYCGIALLGVGALGVVFKTVEFVRVTIPSNYGSNPGFGAYETTTALWWAAMSLGLGIVVSWKVGLALFALVLLCHKSIDGGRWGGQGEGWKSNRRTGVVSKSTWSD